jgi:hypothetical protein
MADEITIDTLVKVFLKMRDARAAMKKTFDAEYKLLGDKQQRIEVEILRRFNLHKLQNVKTEHGVAYREAERFFKAEDREAYWAWARDNDYADAFSKTPKRRFILDWMEENGGTLPPGVSSIAEDHIVIRKK